VLFVRPADTIARVWYVVVEQPLIAGSLDALGFTARETAEEVAEIQTGFVRSYVLAFAAALSVMVIVFVSVR
jgi:hypothetical protein